MKNKKKILLLTLQTFAAPGGIQRMNRIMSYALQQLSKKHQWRFDILASHDKPSDLISSYVSASSYHAFSSFRIGFAVSSIIRGIRADVVILSHIHLSVIAKVIRILNPGCRIILVAHGIEVWKAVPFTQRHIWKTADTIVCVSSFTRGKIISLHHAEAVKCRVINNPVDPFIKTPQAFGKPQALLKTYHITPTDRVILTLCRIAASERPKGYLQVIRSLAQLKNVQPDLKYILAGGYEENEKKEILQLAAQLGVQDQVIMTGYIPEQELPDLFLAADLFVLPSKKEGFGIVFTEAMTFGLPVICGNSDGSRDALPYADMGSAIDPDNLESLCAAIREHLRQPLTDDKRRDIQKKCMQHFNIQQYTDHLAQLLIK